MTGEQMTEPQASEATKAVAAHPEPKRDSRTVRLIRGNYRGIAYEMNELNEGEEWAKFQRSSSFPLPRVKWCGYVWLDASRIKDQGQRKLVVPEAVNLNANQEGRKPWWTFSDRETIWASAPFHGGCTYVDSQPGPDPMCGPHVKAGCDWSHIWNSEEGFYGSANAVEANLVEVIDWLISRLPELRPAEDATMT